MNTKGKKYYGDQIVADKVILGTYSQVPKLWSLLKKKKQKTKTFFHQFFDLGLEGSEGGGEGTGKWEFSLKLNCSVFSPALKIKF